MNKTELMDALSQNSGLSKVDAAKFTDALAKVVTEVLQSSDQVTIPGLGAFAITNRAARVGRNPKTGEPIQIAASRAAKFKAGKALKDALSE